MKGLDLSRRYFYDVAYPVFKREYPEILNIWAVGLVGEGSECFNLDDKISQDHDFGPGFCIWLSEKDKYEHKENVSNILNSLNKEYLGYKRIDTYGIDKRIGLFSIEEFYQKYTSFREFPISDLDFLKIPETFLATCTNGEVFIDNLGKFTQYRDYLKNFYPEDVLKKKLAAYLAIMGQSGQYNLERSIRRGDSSAIFFSKAEYIDSLFGVLFLLAREYMPYYKLKYRKLEQLNYYPKQLLDDIKHLQSTNNNKELLGLVEKISLYIRDILNLRHYTISKDTFLINQAIEIQKSINNSKIKSIHLMKGN